MLVLALQFSRCKRAQSGQPADSLKTEEKTRSTSSDCLGGPGPATRPTSDDDPTVHQLGCPNAVWLSGHCRRGNGLLRKEVIQPHLPVRLPCYDFTPITDPTFDGSLPEGLGHRLRVLPTFVV